MCAYSVHVVQNTNYSHILIISTIINFMVNFAGNYGLIYSPGTKTKANSRREVNRA